jgi:hypothetical protein
MHTREPDADDLRAFRLNQVKKNPGSGYFVNLPYQLNVSEVIETIDSLRSRVPRLQQISRQELAGYLRDFISEQSRIVRYEQLSAQDISIEYLLWELNKTAEVLDKVKDEVKQDAVKDAPKTRGRPKKKIDTEVVLTKEEFAILEPAKQEPTKQEPTKQEPAKQEPAKQDPTKQEPAKQEPAKQDPTKQEPTKQEPAKQKEPKMKTKMKMKKDDTLEWVQEPSKKQKKKGSGKQEALAPVPLTSAPEPEPVLVSAIGVEGLHIRRKNIPKHIKTLVWNKYLGVDKAEAKCFCCRQERIDVRNFHCGHVIAEAKGGDLTINNLRPVCPPCNLSMGTRSMNEFTSEFFGWTV